MITYTIQPPQIGNKIGMYATANYAQGLFYGNKRATSPFTEPIAIMLIERGVNFYHGCKCLATKEVKPAS